MMEEEIWKDIPGYEGLYQISNIGVLKTLANSASKKEKFSKPTPDKDGYFKYALSKKGVHVTRSAHQLVAMTFLNHERCGMKLVVDHINGIKTDNRVENLRVTTSYDNVTNLFRRDRETLSSQYVGVSQYGSSVNWKSTIRVGGILRLLGFFDLELEAAAAYQIAFSHVKNGTFDEHWAKIKSLKRVPKGYSFIKSRGKWCAEITINGKRKYLGRYLTEQEASNAYQNELKRIPVCSK